jgi:hypothetical protein
MQVPSARGRSDTDKRSKSAEEQHQSGAITFKVLAYFLNTSMHHLAVPLGRELDSSRFYHVVV